LDDAQAYFKGEDVMKIGIIGTGKMGTALGRRWAQAGHEVCFGSRDPARAEAVAQTVGGNTRGGHYSDAVAFGEVLLLSVPWKATQEVVESLGSLQGKVLLECTNNVGGDDREAGTTELVSQWAKDAKVVKAFNTIFYQVIEAEHEPLTVFIVGDDDAKAKVTPLVRDAGFDPLDAGPIDNSHYLDALARFIIHLGYQRGMGQHIAYKLVHI
jgi:predicted dinucleotide-binding enzyme